MSPVGKNVETEVQARAQPIGQKLLHTWSRIFTLGSLALIWLL